MIIGIGNAINVASRYSVRQILRMIELLRFKILNVNKSLFGKFSMNEIMPVQIDPLPHYWRIDRMRAHSEMRDALTKLPQQVRRKVILLALHDSKYQFTWSFFATTFGVPESDWPESTPEWRG